MVDINLSWNSVSDATGYLIFRRRGSSATSVADYTNVASVSGETTTTYTDTLSEGGEYHYRVLSTNSYGPSRTPTADVGVSLITPPRQFTVTNSSTQGEISLSWNAQSTANGYRIYRAQSSGSTKSDYTQVADVSSTSYTDTGLEDGEKYFYVATSYDGDGETGISAEVTATTLLPAPSSLSGSYDTSNDENNLSWTKNDNSSDGGVSVERSTDDGSSWSTIASGFAPSTTSVTDPSLPSGETDYKYRVVRSTPHATSGYSNTITIFIVQPPSNLTVTGLDDPRTVELSWDGDPKADGFYIYRSKSSGSTPSDYTRIGDVTASPYVDNELEDGVTHHYVVTAYGT